MRVITCVLGVVAVGPALAGCAPGGASDRAATDADRWTERAQTVLHDADALGGGGGGVPGSVQLQTDDRQDLVVYAACTGTELLRVRVLVGTETVGESDVVCGVTARVPVVVEPNGTVRVTASAPDGTDGAATWWAAINSPDWQQSATRFG